ncbi:MAG: hypothetical protein ABIJ22_03190 [Patescibacteria group bacterium]
MPKFPQSLQAIFWSADLAKLDLKKHQKYIIHQVLHYGDIDDFLWLKKQYPLSKIKHVFIDQPEPIYSPKSYNFTKNFLLKINKKYLNPDHYVSNLS